MKRKSLLRFLGKKNHVARINEKAAMTTSANAAMLGVIENSSIICKQ
jgi:hypothetical protein